MDSFDIDIVVVGANQSSILRLALEKLLATPYSRGALHFYYLDMGSIDGSLEIARGVEGVEVVSQGERSTTPGAGYNRGWRAGKSPYVQFLSLVCQIDGEWLERGIAAMGREVGAAAGVVQPLHPEASIFNWLHAIEWRHKSPSCGMGRNFLIRRELLEQLDGFDEQIPFGLIRDLSEKIDSSAWRRVQLGELMATCNLGTRRFRDWFREGVEDGEGRAALRYKEGGWPSLFGAHDLRQILIRGGIPYIFVLLVLLGWIFGSFWYSLLLLPSLILLLFPRIFNLQQIGDQYGLSPVDAAAFGWHIALVVVPQFWGWLRFSLRKLFPR